MRKLFLAQESMGGRQEVFLSLEEEMAQVVEATGLEGQIQAEVQETNRAVDTVDALDNLADVSETIEGEPTVAEAAMVEIVGDAAVAGTDVPAESIVPSTESHGVRRISVEGIRDTAKAIWESIKAVLKKIWAKLEEWWHKFFGTIPSLKRRIKSLKERVENISGLKLEEKNFTVSSSVEALCVNYKGVKDGAELNKELKSLEAVTSDCLKDITKDMAKFGDAIADLISDTDSTNAAAKASELQNKLIPMIGKLEENIRKEGVVTVSGWEAFRTAVSPQMIGNFRLMAKIPKQSTEKDSTLAALDIARRAGIVFGSPRESGNTTVPSDFVFKTLDYSQAMETLSYCEKILDSVEEHERGRDLKEVKKAKERLDSASEKASKAYEKASKTDEAAEKANLPFFRSMLNFNVAFTNWVSEPSVKICSSAVRTVRASMVLVEKSCAQYK